MIIGAVAVMVAGGGCRGADDGLSDKQRDTADRLQRIVTASGGDWNKVPPADRQYVLTNVTFGNEGSARMLLLMKAGKMKANPGGPPK
jgi:hypothetical protein